MEHYEAYRDGPHILLKKDRATAYHFAWDGKRWAVETQPLDQLEGARIEVANPILEPFTVRIQPNPSRPASRYPGCSKLLVISDIEGNLPAFYELLVAQQVVDARGNWIFGEGQLVMLGDLFDRGPDVTPLLWLLYKLEQEAQEAGGQVHILLGNHELMIFEGDLRYIHPKYRVQTRHTGIRYNRLFSTESVLGRWLRSKPAVVCIGDLLFSHAGISPAVLRLEYGLQEINELVHRRSMGRSVPNKATLLFGSEGIFWYRDWVDDPPGPKVLDQVLDFYGARHLIIGHTIVPRIQARYDHKLIQTDLHQPHDRPDLPVRALRIEDGAFFEVDSRGKQTPIPSQ